MHRRQFLQNVALAAAASAAGEAADPEPAPISEFSLHGATWKVYEDFGTRDGSITFVSSTGAKRVLPKTAEAAFAEADPPHLGLSLNDIGMAGRDLLAEKLLEHGGDPDPEKVKSAAPPLGSVAPPNGGQGRWTAFVGTRECFDTQPVFPGGNTRTYHPSQYFPELRARLKQYEGMLGWMPAIRKVMALSDRAWIEVLVFGDVEAHDRFIVQTWHRTAKIEHGAVTKVVYGYTYPAFPPARTDPKPEAFYRALLVFAEYWEKQLADL